MALTGFRRSIGSLAAAFVLLGAGTSAAQTNASPSRPVFVLIDDDGINDGQAPNNFSPAQVNDTIAKVVLRSQLPYFQQNDQKTDGNVSHLPRSRSGGRGRTLRSRQSGGRRRRATCNRQT